MIKMNRKQCFIIGTSIILTLMMGGCSNKATSYYKSAQELYKKGNYEEAAAKYEKAIKQKDDNADYYINYGFCLVSLGEYEKAKENFERAILDKKNTIVNKNNKKAYRGLGILSYTKGDYGEAIEQFEKALTIDSLNEYDQDIISYIGNANYALGDYETAISNYTEVLKSDEKNQSVLCSRGQAYVQLEQYEESIKDFMAAKKLAPNDFDIYFSLYQMYEAQNDTENAEKILNEAANLKVNDLNDQFALAKVHYYQGNLEQAFDEFESLSKEGFVESNLFMGDIYYSEGNYAKACTYYEEYLASGATFQANYYSRLITCYIETENYAKAKTVMKEALSKDSNSSSKDLLKNEIILYECLGNYKTAYKKAKAFVKNYPDDEDAKKELEFLKTRQSKDESKDDTNKIEKP